MLRHRTWNFNIDRYIDPLVPPPPWPYLPYPVARLFGYRKAKPVDTGNLMPIFWAFIKATGGTRKRYRLGDSKTPISQHNHINRKKSSLCLGCQGIRFDDVRSQSVQKGALSEVREAQLNTRKKAVKTRLGCDVCDVAICKNQKCWDFYHRLVLR
jgi:hypothetical protein